MMPIACFLILASALHVPLSAMNATILVPVIMLATMLPLSIAGWGMREGAAILLLGQVGINAPDAVLLSVLFGLIALATACFGGLLWLLSRDRRSRQTPLAEHKYPS
jgi:glycosyltransferase 2 family protein